MWIENGILTWDDKKQQLLSEWKIKKEAPQPKNAITKFKKLNKRDYPGS